MNQLLTSKRANLKMEIRPSLKIDWKKDILSEKEIKNVAICYSQMLRLGLDKNEDNPLNYYFGGLTYSGLNDLNYRTESQSYINFYLCLKNGMKYFGILNNNDNYIDIFNKLGEFALNER